MEDLPTSLLLQQESAKPRTGEELETLGKYAARQFLDGSCGSLTDAVVQTVKSAGLAPEQVRRVVEFTNTEAYLRKFASAGPQHKVVTFKNGPASLPDVLRDLNDGGGGTVFDKAASVSDYALPPPVTADIEARNLQHFGLENTKLAEAFGVNEVPLPFTDPLKEAMDARDKVASVYNEATYELSSLETQYMGDCDDLFNQVKQAALGGISLGHIVAVMQTVTGEPEFVKAAFQILSPRLIQNEVFRNHAELGDSLMKFANAGMVNSDHPLVMAFGGFCETLLKMAATRQVQEDAAQQLDVLGVFLKQAASKAQELGQAVGSVVQNAPKVWRAARDTAARASAPARDFVTAATGNAGVGNVAGKAVQYAPHAAAALVGEEAYQRLKNNHAANLAENFVLSRIPYTRQNMIRQYNMQS